MSGLTESVTAELLRAIKELEHCLSLLDGEAQGKNEFYIEPSLAVIDYCRTIIKLAKQESSDVRMG